MQIRPRAACLLLILLTLSLSACSAIRDAIDEELGKRRNALLLEEYSRLDDCARVEMVTHYLEQGKMGGSSSGGTWVSNGTMLSMLMDLSHRTDVTIEIMTSCWNGFHYGSNDMWLELVGPWRAVLGCSDAGDRMKLLRARDAFLADAYDAILASPATNIATRRSDVKTMSWELEMRIERHLEQLQWRRDNLLLTPMTLAIAETAHRASYRSFSASYGSATFHGLLPDDADPEVSLYLAQRLDSSGGSVVIAKIVAAEEPDPLAADGTAFLITKRSNGSLSVISSWMPAVR